MHAGLRYVKCSCGVLIAIAVLAPKKIPSASRVLTKVLEILEETHITVSIQRHGNKEATLF